MALKTKPTATKRGSSQGSVPTRSSALRFGGASVIAQTPAPKAGGSPVPSSLRVAVDVPSAPSKAKGLSSPLTKAGEVSAASPASSKVGTLASLDAAQSGGSLPSRQRSCAHCQALFLTGQSVYGGSEEGKFLCHSCAEESIAWQPKTCSVCANPFSSGQAVYRYGLEGEAFACERCAEKQNAMRPKCCSRCSATFSPVCATFVSEGSEDVLCRACANAQNAEKPKCCSGCSAAFTEEHTIFKSEKTDGFLCEKCLSNELPVCAACGKPARGTVGKVGDKFYHTDCLVCSLCSEKIEGRCSLIPRPICSSCGEHVKAKFQHMKQLTERGDTSGARKVFDGLRANGFAPNDFPTELG